MLRRRRGRLSTLILLSLAALAAAGGCTSRRQARPSVLFIVMDDLSFHIGLYGDEARTPQMSRLAQRGRRFDRAYCQYPLCNPSRTSFLTGWRPERTKVWGNLRSPRAWVPGAVPLQEHFHANGYFTARVGKIYHSRFEDEFRWDVVKDTYDSAEEAGDEEEQTRAGWGASSRRDEEEPDGRAVREAVRLLEEKRDAPFFIAVGFLRPHGPWIAPERYFRMYPPGTIRLPEPGPAPDLLRSGNPDLVPEGKKTEVVAAYRACVTFADAQLGLLLDALDRLRLWDRTVVVLLSDNGLHVGEHGLFGKMTLFEECARVPLVVAAPGLARPGTPTVRLVELVDLYPTLVELARLPPVPGLDGTSLVPLLEDPGRELKTAAFTLRKVGAARKGELAWSLRTERYRYTEWPDGTIELYDHETDPGEEKNLAHDPRYAATVRDLAARLEAGPKAAASAPGTKPSQ